MTEDKKILQKPFLKWVGGKTQIITQIIKYLPTKINNYHEIFLGGGSVLLAVLSLRQQKQIEITGNIYASDLNPHLINLYQHLQSNKDELFSYIDDYRNMYDSLSGNIVNRQPKNLTEAQTSKESYYYWVRNLFNQRPQTKSPIELSAIFLFLNKTCFRGLYREGPNGFNVPYGHYKKTPQIMTHDELDTISYLIQDVIFQSISFTESLTQHFQEGDFVYLDPPYVPEKEKSFVEYHINGFSLDNHKQLFQLTQQLSPTISFLMNNAKVDLVLDNFKDKQRYRIEELIARRAINSKNPAALTKEVIITNLKNL